MGSWELRGVRYLDDGVMSMPAWTGGMSTAVLHNREDELFHELTFSYLSHSINHESSRTGSERR
jgi:hypothetical protein